MHCNLYSMSTCLCGCNCDYSTVSMCAASLNAKSSRTHRNLPIEPSSCCCNYNPFTDEMEEIEIHDLGFAVRKLAVMKCHMKKWRIERLQLESETRSLKKTLQSAGVKVKGSLKEDPLLIHYRDENIRLEKIRGQLEDKIKNLEETKAEYELYRNPCSGIQIIRDKMRALREQSDHDKKKLNETITELKGKLAKAGDESPCAGVNRLRAQLRQLIDERSEKKIVDKEQQQSVTIVEKSIEMSSALSKSCDDLRVEIERIRVENENLRRELRSTVDDVDINMGVVQMHSETIAKLNDVESAGVKEKEQTEFNGLISELKNNNEKIMENKLIECNNLIGNFKKELDEKNNLIQNLQKKIVDDVGKMNNKILTTEVVNNPEELERKLIECNILNEDLKRMLDERDNTIQNLQKKIADDGGKINDKIMTTEVVDNAEELKIKLINCHGIIESLEEELDRKDEIIKDLQKEKSDDVEEMNDGILTTEVVDNTDEFKKELIKYNNIIENLKKELDEKNHTIQKLQEEKANDAKKINDKIVKTEPVDNQEELEIKLIECNNLNENLKQMMDEKDNIIQDLQKKIADDGGKINDKIMTTEVVDNAEELNIKLINCHGIIESLEEELDRKDEIIKDLQKEKSDDVEEINDGILTTEVVDNTDELKRELIKYNDIIENMKIELDKKDHTIQKLQEEKADYFKKINDKIVKTEPVDNQEELEIKLIECNNLNENLKQMMDEKDNIIQDLQKKIADDGGKINDKIMTTEVVDNAEELKIKLINCHGTIESLEEELDRKDEIIKDLQKKNSDDVEEINDGILATEVVDNTDELRRELIKYNDIIENMKIELNKKDHTIQKLQEEKANDAKKINDKIVKTEPVDNQEELEIKLIECNNLNKNLKQMMDEKDKTIQNLQKKIADDFNKTNDKILTPEVVDNEGELKRCENKVKELLNQLEQSSLNLSELDNLKSQMEVVQVGFNELKVERDKFSDEVNELRKILSDKNDETSKIPIEKDKILGESQAENAALQNRLLTLDEELKIDRPEIDTKKEKLTNDLRVNREEIEMTRRENERIPQLESSNKKYQDEVDNLNNTVGNLLNKLEDANKSKDNALLELTTLKKELEQLVIKLENVHRENSNLQGERNMLENQMIKIQMQLTESTSELSQLRLNNEALKMRTAELEHDIDNWKLENNKSKLEIDKHKGDLDNDKKDLESIHNRMDIDNQLSNSKNEHSKTNKLNEISPEKNVVEDNDLNKMIDLKEELDALKNELKNCRSENEKLQKNLSETKRVSTQLNKDIDNFKSEIVALKNHNEELKRDNELMKQDSIGAQNELQTVKDEAAILRIDNSALKSESDRLRTENSNIGIDWANLKNTNENSTSALELSKSDLLKCQTERDKLKMELIKLEDESTNDKKKLHASTRELEVLRESLNKSEHEAHTLTLNFNALKAEKDSLLVTLNDMREEVEALKRNVIAKDSELKATEAAKDELIALKNELNKCRDELERCNRELDQSKKQIDIFKNGNEIDKGQLSVVNKKVDVEKKQKEIENESDALKKQLEESRMNIDVIKAEVSSKNTLLEEMNALKNTLGKLRKDLEKCSMENDRLQRDLDKWQNDAIKSTTELDEIKKVNLKFVSENKVVKDELDYLNREMGDVKLKNSRLEQDLIKMQGQMENTLSDYNKLKIDNKKMETDKDELLRKYDEMRNEKKNFVDNMNKCEREIERLKAENDKVRGELETVRKELNSALRYDGKMMIEENKDRGEVLPRAVPGELKKSMEEVELLRRMNNELTMNLEKLKSDIGNFENENKILKANIDDSSKLKKTLEELEKWKRITDDLRNENRILSRNLEAAVEDLRKAKRDEKEIAERSEAPQSETLKEHTKSKGSKQRQLEVEKLQGEIQRLKNENEILIKNLGRPLSVQQTAEVTNEKKNDAKNLRKKDNGMKNNFDGIQVDQSNPDMEMRIPEINREHPNNQIFSDTPDMSNELIRALDIIRIKMEKQRKGVIRIRENIDNMAKQIWSESSKYIDSDDSIVLNTMNPIIAEVLELSNDLSTNIFTAEKELMNLGRLWRARWEENTRLKKLVEDLGGTENLEKFKLSEENSEKHDGNFDSENWWNSLTLTQLADLHDKVCFLTSTLVQQDCLPTVCDKPVEVVYPSSKQDHLQQNYIVLDKRIAALQRQITEMQLEAGEKVSEMRQVLRREQIELVRISEALNHEKKRNLKLHSILDESTCWTNDCGATVCDKRVKFLSNTACRK